MKKFLTRKMIAVNMAALLCFLSACSAPGSDEPGHGKWRDSDLTGSVSADDEIRLQDDFVAAVNKDWILDASYGDSAFGQVSDTVIQKKRELINDTSLTGKKANELKKFTDLAEDWETRDMQGAEPVRKYVEAIESISSLDELGDYFCDREKNPLELGLLSPTATSQSYQDTSVYAVSISLPTLLLGGEESYYEFSSNAWEAKNKIECITDHVLSRLDYDQGKIDAILKGNFRIEKMIAGSTSFTVGAIPEEMSTWDECIEAAESYPLENILNAWGLTKETHFYMDTGYAKKLKQIYKASNLEDIKAMLIVHLVNYAAHFIDKDTYNLEREMSISKVTKPPQTIEMSEEEEADVMLFDDYVANSVFSPILDELYLKKYFKKKDTKRLQNMTDSLIDEFEEIFSNEEWMSEDGRSACIDKLNALSTHVIYPNFEQMDYSNLNIKSKEDGGTFFDAICDSAECIRNHYAYLSSIPYDSTTWDPLLASTTDTNAMYMPTTNGIYIFAGILEDPFYNSKMSEEQLLGGIGIFVGHEITHGFDKNGATYDKYGMEKTWMSFEDQMSFSDKESRVGNYYSTIHPYPGSESYNGSQVSAEATADMGGIRATLSIASKIPGFDYDEYFRHYASIWAEQVNKSIEESNMSYDEHPLGYLRANVGLQQFEEFYETYDIAPDDGMYLSEDKRIAVW